MGRIAADRDDDGTETVYVPGTEHLWRLTVHGDRLRACWIMDCGDITSVRHIHTVEPNGRDETAPPFSGASPPLAPEHSDYCASHSMTPTMSNGFTDAFSDDLVVVDVRSGELFDRVATGSRIANGMFLTPGGNRDVGYCSTLVLSHVCWT